MLIEYQVSNVMGQIANLPQKQVWQPAPHATLAS
jgi:hypothetical protein